MSRPSVGLLFFVCAIVLQQSCSNRVEIVESRISSPPLSLQESLVPTDTIAFPLDSRTNFLTNNILYRADNNSVVFLNEFENAIYSYSLETLGLLNIQKYELEGPNGVGKIDFFQYQSEDSIWVYSGELRQLSLIVKDTVYKRIDISAHPNVPLMGWAEPQTTRPIFIEKNLAYIPTIRTNDSLFQNIIVWNLLDNSVKKIIPSPKLYFEGVELWGTHFQWYYYTLNSTTGQLVFSFPALHTLRVYDLFGENMMEPYAGSKYFDYIRSPFSPGDFANLKARERLNRFLLQPSFGAVLFDPFNGRYYRYAKQANTHDRVQSSDNTLRKGRPKSIVILNENFEKVGESDVIFPNAVLNQVFIAPDGLYIAIVDDNENTMTFVKHTLRGNP